MGKRSDFVRHKNDLYRTFDTRAGAALRPHLGPMTFFYEPCAGDGALVRQLENLGFLCVSATDLEPSGPGVMQLDALDLDSVAGGALIITNPPWSRPILHRLIVHFSDIAPTWLLFDADWKHTVQAAPYLDRLRKVVSIGRLKWIEDSKHGGKDNCAWYLFGPPMPDSPPVFYGRRGIDHAVNSR